MDLSKLADLSFLVDTVQKHFYIYLFLLCSIVFAIYLFNPVIIGADTWFYVGQVCDKSTIDFRDIAFVPVLFLLPCSFIVMKLYLFVLFLISMFTMAKIGELYFKEKGAILGIITGFLTLIILEFQVFENDSLGYTLFFIALYFAIKYSREHTKVIDRDALLSAGFAILSGLAWKGVAYFLIPLVVFNPVALIIAIPVIALNFQTFFWFLNGSGGLIMEQAPWVAFIYYGITIFFLYGILKTPKKEAFAFILMCIPGVFVQKLFVLAIPFISIIALHGVVSIKKYQDTIVSTLIIFSLFMAIYWGMHSFNEFPTQSDIELIEFAKTKTDVIQNVFGPGYVIEYYGITPSSKGMTDGNKDYNCTGYVIEHPQLQRCDCNILKKSNTLILESCNK